MAVPRGSQVLRRSVAVGLAVFAVSCSKDLTIPPQPKPARVPIITSFAPHAAFSGSQVIVYADNVDAVGNVLEFPGGFTVLADTLEDGGETRVADGGISFVVPEGLEST